MPLYCTKGHENPTTSRFCQYCGEKLPQPTVNIISQGLVLGDRYRIVREIGHGGFGRTYLSEDLNRFNERCVLKEFAPKVQGSYALQKAEELFEREAGVLYQLQHPQIPHFRELFRLTQPGGAGKLFLVQDYVEGQTYRALVDNRQRQGLKFSETEVTQLLLQILPVIEYIHSLGVIHRDISPDNMILRSADGLPVLIDFGGVKQVAATVESQFNAAGTPNGVMPIATRLGKVGYAPDEQMQKGIVAPNSDLYALAVTALVLLTGKQPQQLIDPQTLAWDWHREVSISPTLRAILDKMVARNPGDRYQSAQEVLQAISSNSPPPAPPIQPKSPPQPPTVATVPVVPVPVANPQTPPVFTTQTPPTKSGFSFMGLFGKTLLVLLLIFSAGSIGWWGGKLWLKSNPEQGKGNPQPPQDFPTSPPVDVEKPPEPVFSDKETERKEALRQRRQALGINSNFYIALVNQIFRSQNPSLKNRALGTGKEDEQLREQWDQLANQLLDKLERSKLSLEVRQRLGNYNVSDRTRFRLAVNKLRLSSRALNDLTDAKYLAVFPEYTATKLNLGFEQFLTQPTGQVWHAIASDNIKSLQSGSGLEIIRFEPGTISKEVTGSLNPGEGKAYIAQLSQSQQMEVQLQTNEKAFISIYSPTGQTNILEDSKERKWSGKLPESGYYEFVIVSAPAQATKYTLTLIVENSPANSSTPIEQPSPSEQVP